mmetsp:Transcript_139173/g.259535  ORF Transcript_139173/g.259535 Transcript_139173/m.259535 type:complete len:731 (-) Transcript_139173:60-2252(-)
MSRRSSRKTVQFVSDDTKLEQTLLQRYARPSTTSLPMVEQAIAGDQAPAQETYIQAWLEVRGLNPGTRSSSSSNSWRWVWCVFQPPAIQCFSNEERLMRLCDDIRLTSSTSVAGFEEAGLLLGDVKMAALRLQRPHGFLIDLDIGHNRWLMYFATGNEDQQMDWIRSILRHALGTSPMEDAEVPALPPSTPVKLKKTRLTKKARSATTTALGSSAGPTSCRTPLKESVDSEDIKISTESPVRRATKMKKRTTTAAGNGKTKDATSSIERAATVAIETFGFFEESEGSNNEEQSGESLASVEKKDAATRVQSTEETETQKATIVKSKTAPQVGAARPRNSGRSMESASSLLALDTAGSTPNMGSIPSITVERASQSSGNFNAVGSLLSLPQDGPLQQKQAVLRSQSKSFDSKDSSKRKTFLGRAASLLRKSVKKDEAGTMSIATTQDGEASTTSTTFMNKLSAAKAVALKTNFVMKSLRSTFSNPFTVNRTVSRTSSKGSPKEKGSPSFPQGETSSPSLARQPIEVGKTRLGVYVYRVVQVGLNRLVVSKGDITSFSGDAIVNAANESAVAGGGVAASITRAAGAAMTKELAALPEVRPMVRIPVGQARITHAGKLKVEHVIHAVGPQYTKVKPIGGFFKWEAYDQKLKDAYQASIALAVANSCWVVAFSCLSTGAFMGERGLDTVLTIGLSSLNECLLKHPGPPVEVHMVTDSGRVLGPLIQVFSVLWPV